MVRPTILQAYVLAFGVAASVALSGEPSGRLLVQILADGKTCSVQGQSTECTKIGAFMRDTLKVPASRALSVIGVSGQGNLQVTTVTSTLSGAGYKNVAATIRFITPEATKAK